MKLFLLPGDLAADWVGLPAESDHRQVFRSFFNTIFWGTAGSIMVVLAMI